MATALTTLARVKERLGITGTGHDALLTRLIEAASDYLARETGLTFVSTPLDVVEEHDGGMMYLYPRRRPVVEFVAVEERLGDLENPQWTALDVNYRVLEIGLFPKVRLMKIRSGVAVWRLTYRAGYVVDFANTNNHTLPSELTDVVERMVVRLYTYREHEGKTSVAGEGGSVQWDIQPTEEERAILAHYKRVLL